MFRRICTVTCVCRCGLEDLYGPESAPYERTPWRDVAHHLYDIAVSVKKRRIYWKRHEERVDGIAPQDQHALAWRQSPGSDKAFHPGKGRTRDPSAYTPHLHNLFPIGAFFPHWARDGISHSALRCSWRNSDVIRPLRERHQTPSGSRIQARCRTGSDILPCA